MNSDTDGIIQFLLYVGQAKRTLRTGWVLRGVERIESVADHMYRMALMSMLLSDQPDTSKVRCMKLSLVHDLAESVVGDLTEYDGIPKQEKHRQEFEAMIHMTNSLPESIRKEIIDLFQEYTDQKTQEAQLVKDFDIFDMLLQAYEYEKIQDQDGYLQDFFVNSMGKIQSALVKKWLEQLIASRSKNERSMVPPDSNLNTLLRHILYDNQGKYLYGLPGSDLRKKSEVFMLNQHQRNNPEDHE